MKKYFLLLSILFLSFNSFAIISNTLTTMTATTTSTLALAADTQRKYLIIQNRGASGSATVYVKFGSAHTGTEGIEIVPGGNYEPYWAPYNSVYIESSTSTQQVQIYSGTGDRTP